jgi:hypothetical protein
MKIEIDKSGINFITDYYNRLLENKNNIIDNTDLVKFQKLLNIIKSSNVSFCYEKQKNVSSKEDLYELYGFSKEQISQLILDNDSSSIYSILVRYISGLSFGSTLCLNSFQFKNDISSSFEKNGVPTILNITNGKSLDYLTIPISSNNKSIKKLVEKLFNFNSFALALPEFLSNETTVEKVFFFIREYFKNIKLKKSNSNLTIFYCVSYMKDYRSYANEFGRKSKYWRETPEILYFAQDLFNNMGDIDFEFVPLEKKMENDKYLDRYFFSPFNYSSFQHFFGSNDSTQWIQNDFYSVEKTNEDVKENIKNYETLISKYLKRIQINHILYYSNKSNFKNRLFDFKFK